jgi:hypothetical protein
MKKFVASWIGLVLLLVFSVPVFADPLDEALQFLSELPDPMMVPDENYASDPNPPRNLTYDINDYRNPLRYLADHHASEKPVRTAVFVWYKHLPRVIHHVADLEARGRTEKREVVVKRESAKLPGLEALVLRFIPAVYEIPEHLGDILDIAWQTPAGKTVYIGAYRQLNSARDPGPGVPLDTAWDLLAVAKIRDSESQDAPLVAELVEERLKDPTEFTESERDTLGTVLSSPAENYFFVNLAVRAISLRPSTIIPDEFSLESLIAGLGELAYVNPDLLKGYLDALALRLRKKLLSRELHTGQAINLLAPLMKDTLGPWADPFLLANLDQLGDLTKVQYFAVARLTNPARHWDGGDPTYLRYLNYLSLCPPWKGGENFRKFQRLVTQQRFEWDAIYSNSRRHTLDLAATRVSWIQGIRRVCADWIAGPQNKNLREGRLLPLYPAPLD